MKHRHNGNYISKTPRGRLVLKRRPIHMNIVKKGLVLKKPYRAIFQELDKKPFETGGYMDFNKKGLERADVYIGKGGHVDIDITPDKELTYHSHPSVNDKLIDKLNAFPSKGDINAADEFPAQSMIIFHEGRATVANKMSNFNTNPKLIDKIERGLRKDAKDKSVKELFKKYKPAYKKLGIDLSLVDKGKDIKLPIQVLEPSRVKGRYSGFFSDEPEESIDIQVIKHSARKALQEDPEEVRNLLFEQSYSGSDVPEGGNLQGRRKWLGLVE